MRPLCSNCDNNKMIIKADTHNGVISQYTGCYCNIHKKFVVPTHSPCSDYKNNLNEQRLAEVKDTHDKYQRKWELLHEKQSNCKHGRFEYHISECDYDYGMLCKTCTICEKKFYVDFDGERLPWKLGEELFRFLEGDDNENID